MPENGKTPITQEQWRALQPGHGIKDDRDRIWRVVRRDHTDEDRLIVQEGGTSEGLSWNEGQIIDDDYAVIVPLNRPGVEIIGV